MQTISQPLPRLPLRHGTSPQSTRGGLAALYNAAAYLVTMVYFLIIVDYPSLTGLEEKVAFLAHNTVGVSLLTLIAYVVFGFSLVILALALHDRLRAAAPALMPVATAVGLIWAGAVILSGMIYNAGVAAVGAHFAQDPAQAAAIWLGVEPVFTGLGGGNGEVLGGAWTLLVSWAALRPGGLPRAWAYLGLLVGAAGILSLAPALRDLTGIFGIGQIVWFIWLGLALLRRTPATPQA